MRVLLRIESRHFLDISSFARATFLFRQFLIVSLLLLLLFLHFNRTYSMGGVCVGGMVTC